MICWGPWLTPVLESSDRTGGRLGGGSTRNLRRCLLTHRCEFHQIQGYASTLYFLKPIRKNCILRVGFSEFMTIPIKPLDIPTHHISFNPTQPTPQCTTTTKTYTHLRRKSRAALCSSSTSPSSSASFVTSSSSSIVINLPDSEVRSWEDARGGSTLT